MVNGLLQWCCNRPESIRAINWAAGPLCVLVLLAEGLVGFLLQHNTTTSPMKEHRATGTRNNIPNRHSNTTRNSRTVRQVSTGKRHRICPCPLILSRPPSLQNKLPNHILGTPTTASQKGPFKVPPMLFM